MISRKINKVDHPIYESIEEFKKYNPNINVVDNICRKIYLIY